MLSMPYLISVVKRIMMLDNLQTRSWFMASEQSPVVCRQFVRQSVSQSDELGTSLKCFLCIVITLRIHWESTCPYALILKQSRKTNCRENVNNNLTPIPGYQAPMALPFACRVNSRGYLTVKILYVVVGLDLTEQTLE